MHMYMYMYDKERYRTGIKFQGVFNFTDFVGDFLSTKILTAHEQQMY